MALPVIPELKITDKGLVDVKMDWAPQEADKDAAWDMYVELLTRITIQR